MAGAAREAADPRVLAALDSIRVVNLLSWRYRDPGLLLSARIGAADARPAICGAAPQENRSSTQFSAGGTSGQLTMTPSGTRRSLSMRTKVCGGMAAGAAAETPSMKTGSA